MQKNTPARKALASTVWFQHKHPETAPGNIGRITTAKRYQHMKRYARDLIKDQKLREIILSPVEPKSSGKLIVGYLIEKTGSAENAFVELKRMQKELGNPLNPRFGYTRELLKYSRKKGIPKEKFKEYDKETAHIIAASFQMIVFPLMRAEMQLEQMLNK